MTRPKRISWQNAAALLFPIDWPEPFGLVVIEAMACGTPVIAWRRGSIPEIVDRGVTGLLSKQLAHWTG
jgi:glycosyltransferase involved in cell wall biosynthesis